MRKSRSSPKRPARRAFLWGCLVGVASLALALVALDASTLPDTLVKPLQRPDTEGKAEALVVLGAGYWEPCGLTPSAWQRTRHAVRLFHEGRAERVVLSGGPTQESAGVSIGAQMAELAVALGVPRERVLVETTSRNTHENAEAVAALLRAQGIGDVIVVTDSIHMRRAVACFRKAGLTVGRSSVPQVCVSSSNLAMLEAAAHEYLGYWYYRTKGWVEPD
jgi:uncharacterized SAM-binding protein YcdF (DUF218 family)